MPVRLGGGQLGAWLRAAAGSGSTPDLRPGSGLVFDEPTLSFAFDAAPEDRRLLRVHLTGPGRHWRRSRCTSRI